MVVVNNKLFDTTVVKNNKLFDTTIITNDKLFDTTEVTNNKLFDTTIVTNNFFLWINLWSKKQTFKSCRISSFEKIFFITKSV